MYLAPRQPSAKSRNVVRGVVIGKVVHKCEAGLYRVSMGEGYVYYISMWIRY